MQLLTIRVEKPETINFVLGQTHFIKTVEDIHEALVGAVPTTLPRNLRLRHQPARLLARSRRMNP